jgi:methionyl-tRNA synthetase
MLKVTLAFGLILEQKKIMVCVLDESGNEITRAAIYSHQTPSELGAELKKKVSELEKKIEIQNTKNGYKYSGTSKGLKKVSEVDQFLIEKVVNILSPKVPIEA